MTVESQVPTGAEVHTLESGAGAPVPDLAETPVGAVPPAGVLPPPPPASSAALSPAELWDQECEQARDQLAQLAAETTQREWLIITQKLDRTRGQIGADQGLTMLALAWVKEKHAHGGASWDRLLDMTDDELEALHGFPPGDRPEQ